VLDEEDELEDDALVGVAKGFGLTGDVLMSS
jgi:hypothetical protein